MTVAVTGASGHVGANLVRKLLEDGERVRVLLRNDTRATDGLDVEVIEGDILEEDSLDRAFDSVDVVYHLAGYISLLNDWKNLYKINVQGVSNVVSSCLKRDVGRLVHVSSIEALLSRSCPRPVTEDNPPDYKVVQSPYGRSKALGDQEVFKGGAKGLDFVIVHPTAVVGPYDFKVSHFGKVFLDFATGELPSFVGGGFDMVDVRDLACGMVAAANKGRSGQRYILGGRFVHMKDLASVLEKATGKKRPLLMSPLWLVWIAGCFTPTLSKLTKSQPRFTRMTVDMLGGDFRVSSEKARKEFGYSCRDIEQSVTNAVQWFKEAGYL